MLDNPVKAFIVKALFWLPACFAIWYLLSDYLAYPANMLLSWLLPDMFPNLIHEISILGAQLEVITEITPKASPASAPSGQIGTLAFELNPLIYGYGLPLFTALILASPDSDRRRGLYWLIGFIALSLTQAFGTGMDIMKTLAFGLGPEASQAANLSQIQKEGIALGYQMGTLIFPAVIPVLLWIGFHRQQLAEWAPGAKIS